MKLFQLRPSKHYANGQDPSMFQGIDNSLDYYHHYMLYRLRRPGNNPFHESKDKLSRLYQKKDGINKFSFTTLYL